MGKDNSILIFGGLLGVVGLATVFANKKEIETKVVSTIVKKVMKNKIDTLHPRIRTFAAALLEKAKAAGIDLRITDAYRSVDEQNALYAKGRTAPGAIVTRAKGGQSMHNFGLAIDVVPIENGQANYNTKNWKRIGDIGKSIGFVWGGDWKFVDRPHFEMTFKHSLAQLQNLYASKNLKDGYVNLG